MCLENSKLKFCVSNPSFVLYVLSGTIKWYYICLLSSYRFSCVIASFVLCCPKLVGHILFQFTLEIIENFFLTLPLIP